MTAKSVHFADVSILAAFEAAIRERLATVLVPHGVSVEEFPADPLLLSEPPLKSRILIAFAGQTHTTIAADSWNRSKSVRREVDFDINYDFAMLRSHSAVYFIMDLVNETLQGWVPKVTPPTNLTMRLDEPCVVVSDSFRSLVDGATYLYVTRIRISFVSVVTQRLTDPAQLKSLTVAIHRSEIGDLADSIEDIVLTVTPPET